MISRMIQPVGWFVGFLRPVMGDGVVFVHVSEPIIDVRNLQFRTRMDSAEMVG